MNAETTNDGGLKMREIKFRDWNPELKRMRYYDLDTYDKNEDNQYFTIEQFTGLHDNTKWEDLTEKEKNEWLKNLGNTSENWPGKKIYEGDIVKLRGGKKPKEKERNFYTTIVVFKDSCFTVKENKSVWVDSYVLNVSIVIGNIHENQELINEC